MLSDCPTLCRYAAPAEQTNKMTIATGHLPVSLSLRMGEVKLLAMQTLDSLGLDQVLDLGNGVVKDLLLQLFVLERVLHLPDHAGRQLALLLLTLARLESNPRVEHRLDLGSERRLLSQLKHFLLGLCGLLGHGVQSLGKADDVLLLLYRVNAGLNRLGVFGASAVENLGDFLSV